MNYEAVYRTVLATPGLLNIQHTKNKLYIMCMDTKSYRSMQYTIYGNWLKDFYLFLYLVQYFMTNTQYIFVDKQGPIKIQMYLVKKNTNINTNIF